MAKALDEILQKYFGCSVPFREDGELTTTGEKAMRKLEELLSDLEGIGVIPSASEAVRQLDVITHEGEDNENQNENENPVLREAIKYVRENMDEDDLLIIEATVSKNLKNRQSVWYGVDYGIVERLLYDYGEEHNLIDEDADQEWWEKYSDIDDILCKL